MTSEDQIFKLLDLMAKRGGVPAGLRLFLISQNKWLRIYRNEFEMMFRIDSFINELKYKPEPKENETRGALLDIFSKSEIFVNELIQVHLLGIQSEKAGRLDDILESMNYNTKITLLNRWNIVDSDLLKKLQKLKNTRNDVAHKWSLSAVKYDKIPLEKNFDTLKKDMQYVWDKLIAIYEKE